jgi:UDP-N-acetylglucosamine--N-acetylmuramyl-(pentapeptide) pyrophosphoryl-undecaprenol N-acetylglucosamine transferase
VALPPLPFFAASAGGHLDLLTAVAPQALDGGEPVWVTSRTPRGEALRAAGAQVELLPEYRRSPVKALGNIIAAARIVLRRRPRVVVTSGAGVVAPFCMLARLTGARIIYIETMARVSGASMTARLLSRIAAPVIVQWPELQSRLAGSVVCRPTLLENIGEGESSPGEGTFVAVGTDARPYSRLLRIVTRAIEESVLPFPVRAQVGPASWKADGAQVSAYVSRDEMDDAICGAEVVVCHGGAGIISSALAAGRRPIVIPRRSALGEHVDDHQYQLARKLSDWNLVVHVEERITAGDIEHARHPPSAPAELLTRPSAAAILRRELAR